MKTLILILLFPLSSFAQIMEKNLFAESEILNLFLQVNPKMMDSPSLNEQANIDLLEWVGNLAKDTIDHSLFEGGAGYMTICNMWKYAALDSLVYYDVILRSSKLVIRNAIGGDAYTHILGSYEIGVASYTIGEKGKGGIGIYMAIFR